MLAEQEAVCADMQKELHESVSARLYALLNAAVRIEVVSTRGTK
jgi:hypothetical protein